MSNAGCETIVESSPTSTRLEGLITRLRNIRADMADLSVQLGAGSDRKATVEVAVMLHAELQLIPGAIKEAARLVAVERVTQLKEEYETATAELSRLQVEKSLIDASAIDELKKWGGNNDVRIQKWPSMSKWEAEKCGTQVLAFFNQRHAVLAEVDAHVKVREAIIAEVVSKFNGTGNDPDSWLGHCPRWYADRIYTEYCK